MCIEMIIAEYHQPLDSVLDWSAPRMTVLWRRRNERNAAIRKMLDDTSGGDRGRTRSPRPRRGVPRPPAGDMQEVECKSMAELVVALKVKPEPYPGRTPWNQESSP